VVMEGSRLKKAVAPRQLARFERVWAFGVAGGR